MKRLASVTQQKGQSQGLILAQMPSSWPPALAPAPQRKPHFGYLVWSPVSRLTPRSIAPHPHEPGKEGLPPAGKARAL